MTTNMPSGSTSTYTFISSLGFRVVINALAHPFEYAKVLIQIGHEPFPPYATTTFLGRKVYALPNVFRYVKYIKSVDGLSGCYRGFTPKITSNVVGLLALNCVSKRFETPEDYDTHDELSDDEKRTRFINNLTGQLTCRSALIVASHPFQVIAYRMMAQFVGGEEKYCDIFSSIVEIYREEGFFGFFAGIVPRWIGEIATVVVASTVSFIVSSYVIQDRELQNFTAPTIQYITSAIMYPFTVVNTCMAVNDCGLAAGLPPHMPVYRRWTECWSHLSRSGQLNRGSSLLWRYYFGPINHSSVMIRRD